MVLGPLLVQCHDRAATVAALAVWREAERLAGVLPEVPWAAVAPDEQGLFTATGAARMTVAVTLTGSQPSAVRARSGEQAAAGRAHVPGRHRRDQRAGPRPARPDPGRADLAPSARRDRRRVPAARRRPVAAAGGGCRPGAGASNQRRTRGRPQVGAGVPVVAPPDDASAVRRDRQGCFGTGSGSRGWRVRRPGNRAKPRSVVTHVASFSMARAAR